MIKINPQRENDEYIMDAAENIITDEKQLTAINTCRVYLQ